MAHELNLVIYPDLNMYEIKSFQQQLSCSLEHAEALAKRHRLMDTLGILKAQCCEDRHDLDTVKRGLADLIEILILEGGGEP